MMSLCAVKKYFTLKSKMNDVLTRTALLETKRVCGYLLPRCRPSLKLYRGRREVTQKRVNWLMCDVRLALGSGSP